MERGQIEAVIRRDIRVFFRTSWFFLPLSIVQVLVMQFTTMGEVLKPDLPISLQHTILTGLMGYAPMMIIPFLGNMILNKSMLEQRLRQTITRTLATGIEPRVLWWTKFAVAALLSYSLMFLCEIALWGLVWLRTSMTLSLTLPATVNILLVNPAFSLAVLAMMGLFDWAFKKPGLIIMFLPMAVMFGGWMLAAQNPLLTTQFSSVTAGSIILASAGTILLCGLISSRLSKERVAALY